MQKLFLPLLALLFLVACEKESTSELVSLEATYENGYDTTRNPDKVDVCHYDADNDSWHVINISLNALPAHEGHGDVQLIDEDEDGYVTFENECGIPVDCDDSVFDPENSCCDEGVEIQFAGEPLFVALTDEPGFFTWYQAIDACAAKALAEGCDWYLPNKEELNEMFLNKPNIGVFENDFYWSSTEVGNSAWDQSFSNGAPSLDDKNYPNNRCRCVRK